MTYRVVCERLETIDHVADAVECFHQMTTELGGETNLHGEHSEWALGEWLHILVGVVAYISFSVRLQAALLQETGASRRYSSECPAI